MAQALRINPPLESRGMYLFIMSKHYGNQRPSHTGTIVIVQGHTEHLKETQTHHHSGVTHTNTYTCTGLWIRWRFPSTLLKYAVKYFCNTLSP